MEPPLKLFGRDLSFARAPHAQSVHQGQEFMQPGIFARGFRRPGDPPSREADLSPPGGAQQRLPGGGKRLSPPTWVLKEF